MKLRCLLYTSAALAATAAACGASVEPVSTTTVTMAPVRTVRRTVLASPISNHVAAERITAARCGHELDCDHVGLEKRWSSYDDCVRQLGEVDRDAFAGSGCAEGVDPLALQTCLDTTRKLTCEPAIAASGTRRCSAMDLCL